jgi:hypothetical protein
MSKKRDNLHPIMPRPGTSSVTPEQAHIARERRRSISHGKGKKKKQRGK